MNKVPNAASTPPAHAIDHPILSFYASLSLPDVLCDPTDVIWRQGTPFEAMTGRTAFIDGHLAEVLQRFPQL